MSSPDQYPQLPPGVAPLVAGIASEFAAIRHGAEEAARHSPPVITFPPSPSQDTNFVRPETNPVAIALASGWANLGVGYTTAAWYRMGTRIFARGEISNVAGPLSANSSYTVGYMPDGTFPTGREQFGSWAGDQGQACRVDVLTNGSIVVSMGATGIGINGYVSLSGITYSTL